MAKHLFIKNSTTGEYYNISSILKIEKSSSGMYDLYFTDGSQIRVSAYMGETNIEDIIDFVDLG